MTIYTIIDDNGMPTGSVDMDAITDAGTKFAFALAAAADDHEKVLEISANTLAEHGPKAFGYVAACALQIVVEEVLNPVLEVAEALGTDVRPGLVAVAEGRDPGAA